MKLKSLIRLLVVAVVAMTGTTANAQFLKKLGDAVKKEVKNTVNPSQGKSTSSATAGAEAATINTTAGATLSISPKALASVDMDILSCEGDRASGNVVMTILLSAKGEDASVNFDMTYGRKVTMKAVDNQGTEVEAHGSIYNHSISEKIKAGMPRKFMMIFPGVSPAATSFASVTSRYDIMGAGPLAHSNNDPMMVINGLPIHWSGEANAENAVVIDPDTRQMADIKVMSCAADKKTGAVTLTLLVSAPTADAHIGLGKSNYPNATISATNNMGDFWEGIHKKLENEEKYVKGTPKKLSYTFSGIPQDMTFIPSVTIEFGFVCGDYRLNTDMAGVSPMKILNIPIAR